MILVIVKFTVAIARVQKEFELQYQSSSKLKMSHLITPHETQFCTHSWIIHIVFIYLKDSEPRTQILINIKI